MQRTEAGMGKLMRWCVPESTQAGVLCLSLLLVCSASHVLSSSLQTAAPIHSFPHFDKLGPLKTLVCWQLPEGPVKKVLVVLEGVNIVPTNYWARSASCPACRGLPENVKIIADALAKNYAVFVPRSITPPIGDWVSWPMDNSEITNFLETFFEWKHSLGLDNVPNVGLGTSAGGHIISTLAIYPGLFEAIVIMISHGTHEAFEAISNEYPPTLFIHMPKDSKTAAAITKTRQILDSKGVANAEMQWKEHRVTPDWFALSIPGVSMAISEAIYRVLKQEGYMDENDYLVTNNYRQDWGSRIREWNILPADPLMEGQVMFEDSISQELGVAFAVHVTLARLNRDLFDWLDEVHDSHIFHRSV